MPDNETTGEMLVYFLIHHDVDTVFGIPGAHMYDFNDALAAHSGALRFITTRHEQGAGYMAFGYAKSTGKVGHLYRRARPGRAELRCGALHRIRRDRAGSLPYRQHHVAPDRPGPRPTARTARPAGAAAGLTKWAERINHPTEAGMIMGEAFRQLRGGRRPVAVEAPWDVFGMRSARCEPRGRPRASATAGRQRRPSRAASRRSAGQAPADHGRRGRGRCRTRTSWARRSAAGPVTAHRSGKGILPADNPLALDLVATWEYWKRVDS